MWQTDDGQPDHVTEINVWIGGIARAANLSMHVKLLHVYIATHWCRARRASDFVDILERTGYKSDRWLHPCTNTDRSSDCISDPTHPPGDNRKLHNYTHRNTSASATACSITFRDTPGIIGSSHNGTGWRSWMKLKIFLPFRCAFSAISLRACIHIFRFCLRFQKYTVNHWSSCKWLFFWLIVWLIPERFEKPI